MEISSFLNLRAGQRGRFFSRQIGAGAINTIIYPALTLVKSRPPKNREGGSTLSCSYLFAHRCYQCPYDRNVVNHSGSVTR